MFYQLVKIWVRLALKIFCRELGITHSGRLKTAGPLLVTANHPNSFLDAIIIGSLFKSPVYFLARGDVFRKPWHAGMLRLLQMIPVYRLSEGKEHLALNDAAFSRSKEILEANGILLIFIEGICVNKHELQPFKKGAARIALACREKPQMRILALGIAYNSFTRFGKRIAVHIGTPIPVKTLLPFEEETRNLRHMNQLLYNEISSLIKVPENKPPQINIRRSLLAKLAWIGRLAHRPLYSIIKKIVRRKTKGTVFYDSVLFGALLVIYPAYLLLMGILLVVCHVPAWLIAVILLLHPAMAFLTVRE